jgi:uncharacterized RDD family membrane protein YckC
MAAEVPVLDVPPEPPLPPAAHNLLPALLARNFAPFWMRLVAAILDWLLISIIPSVAGAVLPDYSAQFWPFLGILYSVGFVADGATPGMRALGIRVIDGDGDKPGLKRSLLRYVIPALSWVPVLFIFASPGFMIDMGIPILIVLGSALFVLAWLDPLWMIWDPEKQMLHDKLASTYVVNAR